MRFLIGLFLCLIGINPLRADEISLIESKVIPQSPVAEKKIVLKEPADQESDEEDIKQENDLEEMDDFIKQENEKVKNIKLLNLDLEMATLELKRKEIEEKMSQLNTVERSSTITKQTEDDQDSRLPLIRVVGIFSSPQKKQAVLSIDGQHRVVVEGQEIQGVQIKSIQEKVVMIQYEDGQTDELRLL